MTAKKTTAKNDDEATIPAKTREELEQERGREVDANAATNLAPTAGEATYVTDEVPPLDPENDDTPKFMGEVDRALYLQQKARHGG